MDFTSGIHEESREMDVVMEPSQVSGQEEMVAVIDQEEYRHQASGTSHSYDREEEDVEMDEETECDQEESVTSHTDIEATVWMLPVKDPDYIHPFPGVEVANKNPSYAF